MQFSIESKDVDKAKAQTIDWHPNPPREKVGNEMQSTLKAGISIRMVKVTLEK